MLRFDLLPLDIIREIIGPQQVTKADLCSLRLVSKPLNMLICPTLFSTLNLDFKDITRNKLDFTRCQNIITALVEGSTTVFQHTQHLRLDALRVYDTNEIEMREIFHIHKLVVDKIFHAICSLRNLQTMNFYASSKYPEQLTAEIMRALGTLTAFEGFTNLTLSRDPPSSFTLKPLSNLTIFRMTWEGRIDSVISDIASFLARCPNLSELYLSNDSSSLHELLAQVEMMGREWKLNELQLNKIDVRPGDFEAQTQHFKNLVGLEIRNNPSPTAAKDFGIICNKLWREQGVLLKRVSTDYSNDPLLLSYLGSYSGLTKLCFGTEEMTENDVYMEILPRHAKTLVEYQLHAGPRWSGFISEVQRAGLLRCQRLRALRVSTTLSWEQLLRNKIEKDLFNTCDKTALLWLDIGSKFASLERLEFSPKTAGHAFSSAGTYSRIKKLKEVIGRYRETRGMKFVVNGL